MEVVTIALVDNTGRVLGMATLPRTVNAIPNVIPATIKWRERYFTRETATVYRESGVWLLVDADVNIQV